MLNKVTVFNCGKGDIGTAALWGGNNTKITIDSSIIKDNKGIAVGGVYISPFSMLSVKNTSFINNIGGDWGAAIHAWNAYVNIKSSKFSSNKGGREGDIITLVNTVGVIDSSQFYDNKSGNLNIYVVRCDADFDTKTRVKFSNNNRQFYSLSIYDVNDNCKIDTMTDV